MNSREVKVILACMLALFFTWWSGHNFHWAPVIIAAIFYVIAALQMSEWKNENRNEAREQGRDEAQQRLCPKVYAGQRVLILTLSFGGVPFDRNVTSVMVQANFSPAPSRIEADHFHSKAEFAAAQPGQAFAMVDGKLHRFEEQDVKPPEEKPVEAAPEAAGAVVPAGGAEQT